MRRKREIVLKCGSGGKELERNNRWCSILLDPSLRTYEAVDGELEG